jgi:hypothetical protein
MSLNARIVEQLAQWCFRSETMADVRAKARSDFFGYNEPGTVKYMDGAEELNTRERRFLGWFAFSFRLSDGRHPAELAAEALLKEVDLTAGLKAIQGARYVLAVVTVVIPGKRLFLELEDEEFEVVSPYMSQQLNKEDVICAHLLPAGRNHWVVGPGWLTWPTRFGPGMRSNLKKFQVDPIEVERFVQQRSRRKDPRKIDPPRDKTLEDAVIRMTEAAMVEGRTKLVRSLEEWKSMVLACMRAKDFNTFTKDIVKSVGKCPSLEDLNKWLGMATNIWNNVPQPDRGNKSAVEIIDEYRQVKDTPEK